jgi:hypothetical protein
MRRAALVALLCAAPAGAWETDTTHLGLTEQAALSSGVNARLQKALGRRGGWLEPLAVVPSAFTQLYLRLERVPFSTGARPDARGQQSALGWLRAGALLEGIPATRNGNHFYDPVHKTGLTGKGAGGLSEFVTETVGGGSLAKTGVPAPDWIAAKNNDLGIARFWLELERAGTAPAPTDRSQHLALALVCAGAMLHVLEDVGFPANARDDLKEYLSPLGGGAGDRGSRSARLATFLYGGLGVPAPEKPEKRDRWRTFFTAEDGTGLADVTATRWYSLGTLPGEVVVRSSARADEILGRVKETLRFPSPAPTEINLKRAESDEGGVVRADGVCLATYRLRDERLWFELPDDCVAEQLGAILPVVGGYAAGMLDWLFRGQLDVAIKGGTATVSAAKLGKGTLRLFAEDAQGVRRPMVEVAVAGGADLLGRAPVPAGTARVAAVFKGVDAAGEEVVAIGVADVAP